MYWIFHVNVYTSPLQWTCREEQMLLMCTDCPHIFTSVMLRQLSTIYKNQQTSIIAMLQSEQLLDPIGQRLMPLPGIQIREEHGNGNENQSRPVQFHWLHSCPIPAVSMT